MGKPAFTLLAVLAFLVPASAQTASPAPASGPGLLPRRPALAPVLAPVRHGPTAPFFSLRSIPQPPSTPASAAPPGTRVIIDPEVSVNTYGSATLYGDAPAALDGDIKPYRAWLRLSTSRFEARVGLQKVSFGSATLFRPMMWFDSMDPRDPLQLTDGVYALLLRYYTKGNANFWAGTMSGNDARRGYDLAPPDDTTPDFGARLQVPLFKGEIAATYHHRKAAIDGRTPVMEPLEPVSPLPVEPVPEDRCGLDGKWDLGFGFWLEGALVHQQPTLLPLPYHTAARASVRRPSGWVTKAAT